MLRLNDLVRLQGEGPKLLITKIYDDNSADCLRYEGEQEVIERFPLSELKPVFTTRLRPETDRKVGDIIPSDPFPLVTPDLDGFTPDFSSPVERTESDYSSSPDYSGGGGDFSGGGSSGSYSND